jgi:hypothetical protein
VDAPANAPVSGALSRFQDTLARALLAPGAPAAPEIAALAAQPAFRVYRNTVMKGCIDALQANYPAVARLVGEEWFRAAAAVYAREVPPAAPMLIDYGTDFAAFLARFGPAAGLPYLPGVARLDRLWSEVHVAADDAVLDAAAVSGLAPESLARAVLHPHAAARWAWFDDAPIYTIWSRNRTAGAPEAEIAWQGEGALLTRPWQTVEWTPLGAGGCAFLAVCAARGTLADAAGAALDAQEDTDLAGLMATLLSAGAFGRMSGVARPAITREHA